MAPSPFADRLSTRLVVTFLLAAGLAVLHHAIWHYAMSAGPGFVRPLLPPSSSLVLSLRGISYQTNPFGASIPLLTLSAGLVSSALLLGLSLTMLALIPSAYKVQLAATELFLASAIAKNSEVVIRTLTTTRPNIAYFDIAVGKLRPFSFSIYEVVFWLALAFLYLLVLLRFFRLLPGQRKAAAGAGIIGLLRDPLRENRRPLKVMLGIGLALGAVVIAANGLLGFLDMRGKTGLATLLAAVGSLVLGSLAISLGPQILLWRMIPTRAIDVMYLRSFRLDRQGWATLRRLRRKLGRRVRLSGVVDPKESRQLRYLLYWLTNPFMFALGDQGSINATRHNTFLEGDWKQGIRGALSHSRLAVFDCRTLSENLLWEIRTGLGILGPGRVFFIFPDEGSAAGLQASLAASGLAGAALNNVPVESFVPESDTGALAERIAAAVPVKGEEENPPIAPISAIAEPPSQRIAKSEGDGGDADG